jgi:hypothetical protein
MLEMFDIPTARRFLTDTQDSDGDASGDRPLPLILPLYLPPLAPDQEQMRILLISSPTWVKETIHELHGRGFADPNDWSTLLPGANPNEVVSILTRRRKRR